MHLNGLVDDQAHLLGNHRFHGTHVNPGFFIAQDVHCFGGLQNHELHCVNFDSSPRDQLKVLTEFGNGLSKCDPSG